MFWLEITVNLNFILKSSMNLFYVLMCINPVRFVFLLKLYNGKSKMSVALIISCNNVSQLSKDLKKGTIFVHCIKHLHILYLQLSKKKIMIYLVG